MEQKVSFQSDSGSCPSKTPDRRATVAVFGGVRALDFIEVRQNVVRIPEVAQRLSVCQNVWDEIAPVTMSLTHLMLDDKDAFNQQPLAQIFLAGVIQLGLFERYIKNCGSPDWLMVMAGSTKLPELISGQSDLTEWLAELWDRELQQNPGQNLPVSKRKHWHNELNSTEPLLFQLRPERLTLQYTLEQKKSCANVGEALQYLVSEHGVRQCIQIGPGGPMLSSQFSSPVGDVIEIKESIAMDPLLSWFWPVIGPTASGVTV